MNHTRLSLPSLALLLLLCACTDQRTPRGTPAEDAVIDQLGASLLELGANVVRQDTPVLRVNTKTFTIQDVQLEAFRLLRSTGRRWNAEQLQQIQQQLQQEALSTLVTRHLMLTEARRTQPEVSLSEANEELGKLRASLPEGTTLEEVLEAQKLSKADVIAQIRDDIRLNGYRKQLTDAVPPPTPEDVRTFYDDNPERFQKPEQRRVRQLAKQFTAEMTETDKKRIVERFETLRQNVLDGTDFASIVSRQTKQDSLTIGGELVVTAAGDSNPFTKEVFGLATNQISEVLVRRNQAVVLVQMLESFPARPLTFDEVRENLERGLLAQNQAAALQAEVTRLTERADIELLLDQEETK